MRLVPSGARYRTNMNSKGVFQQAARVCELLMYGVLRNSRMGSERCDSVASRYRTGVLEGDLFALLSLLSYVLYFLFYVLYFLFPAPMVLFLFG